MSRALPNAMIVAIGLVVVACSPGNATPTPGSSATTTPSLAASPAPSPSSTATQALTSTSAPTPAPAPTASPVAAIPLCSPARLAARITAWDAGQGHRTASVEVTNAASVTCKIRALDQPQLIDGHGSVIINSATPAFSAFLVMAPGSVLKALVDDVNYCGPAPVAPVSVAFIYPGGVGRFIATPLSPTDLSGVPPCNGPGSGADISMHPWAP